VAEVELTRYALVVHVRGMDRLWALKSRLEIPTRMWWARRSIRMSRRGGGRVYGLRAPTCRG
jgi:hypothetical protein